jgi:glutamine synthetase
VSSADNLQTFKAVVKSVAARKGLFASFMPKTLKEAAGSGLHVNLSLAQNEKNIFKNTNEGHSNVAESFIAGILAKTPEITLFLNPLANSYERFGKFEAPRYVSWSHQNRSQLVRIPAATGDKVRMELRSPDPSINPYLSFALIIAAGLDGIENNTALPPAIDADLFTADSSLTETLVMLPNSLKNAIAITENSDFIKKVTGEELLLRYLAIKKAEAKDFTLVKDKGQFYKERYFNVI